jgi:carbonic anhydrase/acetyltransferase-like protein (isoleucine patch superfamily)
MSDNPLKIFLADQRTPQVSPTTFIAPTASVIGDVELGDNSSIWFGAVLRGDINRVVVGDASNVQDGAVLHVSDTEPAVLGERVTVGHRAVVHACSVGDEVLVGMGAIILDGACIGPRCVIAAGALVTKGTVVPEGSLVIGSPAKVIRPLSAEEMKANAKLAAKYVELARRYRELRLSTGPVHLPESKRIS